MAAFASGLTRPQVAAKFGVAYNTLSMYIRRHGLVVPRDTRGRPTSQVG